MFWIIVLASAAAAVAAFALTRHVVGMQLAELPGAEEIDAAYERVARGQRWPTTHRPNAPRTRHLHDLAA